VTGEPGGRGPYFPGLWPWMTASDIRISMGRGQALRERFSEGKVLEAPSKGRSSSVAKSPGPSLRARSSFNFEFSALAATGRKRIAL